MLNVLEISRMTNHNGPGLRTLVHFKGGSLRCLWCSTPESQAVQDELGYNFNRCIACLACVDVCPKEAIRPLEGKIEVDYNLCDVCLRCTEECYPRALKKYGKLWTVDDLVSEIEKDALFFKNSGGGVTFSGGEPLMDVSPEMLELYEKVKGAGINIGVDTTGYVGVDNIDRLIPYINFFLWDMKHMDSDIHFKLTNVHNELILENLKYADQYGKDIYIRLPLIPDMNNDVENITAACKFINTLDSVVRVDLVPFHHMGKNRYQFAGKPYLMADAELIPDEQLADIKALVESFGLNCYISG